MSNCDKRPAPHNHRVHKGLQNTGLRPTLPLLAITVQVLKRTWEIQMYKKTKLAAKKHRKRKDRLKAKVKMLKAKGAAK